MHDSFTSETDQDALFWEPVAETRWGQYLSEVERRRILQASNLFNQPGSALEVGAEGGRWSLMLADMGWQMTCTDINHAALRVCQERIPSATCIPVDLEDKTIPCDDDSQDLVLCIEVHEILESDWFLPEIRRVLRPNGALVGVFQNKRSIRGWLKNTFPKSGDTFHHYKVDYGKWRSRLGSLGFEVVAQEGICWMPFSRMSNSAMIPAASQVERGLGLRRLATWSPWVVFVAQLATGRE